MHDKIIGLGRVFKKACGCAVVFRKLNRLFRSRASGMSKEPKEILCYRDVKVVTKSAFVNLGGIVRRVNLGMISKAPSNIRQ